MFSTNVACHYCDKIVFLWIAFLSTTDRDDEFGEEDGNSSADEVAVPDKAIVGQDGVGYIYTPGGADSDSDENELAQQVYHNLFLVCY